VDLIALPGEQQTTTRIMAPTFIDLFCGIGGFCIGLEAAGFECVYADDINPMAVETYSKNRSPDATYPVECAGIREVFAHRLDGIPCHRSKPLVLP
jgi:site-specific DNA-cytosine methylase